MFVCCIFGNLFLSFDTHVLPFCPRPFFVICHFFFSQLSAKECKRLRDIAENCGFTLEKEGDLDLEARKKIFKIEVTCFSGGGGGGDGVGDFRC